MMDFCIKDQDLMIVNGNLAMCSTNRDALAQLISVRLKTLKGEWFMDTLFRHSISNRNLRTKAKPHVYPSINFAPY